MAEKILNTRILNKIDSLENWQQSTLKIKQGEICLATVAASAGTGLTEPVVMAKIGTSEEKTFSELPWSFYAKASDVLAACKSEDSLTAFVNSVIADAGIASSSAMEALAGRVTTAEGEIDALQAELDTAETGLKARMTTAEGAIDALEGLVGDKLVATQISEAITALNLAGTYEVKGEAVKVQTALDTYKTSNDTAVQKNATDISGEIARAKAAEEANAGAITAIKDGTTIDSFADVEAALAGKQATGDYATKAEAQAMADGKDAAIAEAKKAGTDAAAAAAAAQADADALEVLVGDTKVSEQISGAIEDLDLANTYAAKVHTHVKADITDFAHTHEIADVNGLQGALDGKQAVGDYATKAEAQGYADAKDEAIAAAMAAADEAQEEVDALETYVGTIPTDEKYADITNVVAYVNKKAEETLSAAQGGSSETAASVKQQLDNYKDENNTRVKAAEDAIDALEGLVGDTKVSDAIATAVKEEADRAKGIEGGLETRLAAVEGDYLKAADKTELEGKITTNANAIERLTNGVSAEEVDGVNDLIQYVKDHGTEVTGIKADIKANSDAITAEVTRATGVEGSLDTRLQAVEAAVGESGSVAGDIADALAEAKEYTDTEVEGLANGAVATNAANIATLEAKVGDKTVSEQITDVTNPLAERVVALEAIDHDHANKSVLDGIEATDITAWDAKVDDVTAAADSGLKATRTGNAIAIEIDDSVTFIFDCGTSAE